MRNICIILCVLTALVLANDECSLDTKPIILELEKRYSNEIKSLTFQKTAPCQQIKGSNDYAIYLAYREPFSDENSDVYSLSLALAVVDKHSLKLKQSFFHKNIAQSDAISIDEIAFDTSLPKGFLGLHLSFYGSSRVNPYSSSSLYVYKIEKKKLKLILNNAILSDSHGENNTCNYINSVHFYKFVNKSSFKFKSPLYFQHSYVYEESYCKDESKDATWKVNLDKIKWVYKNGVYKQETKEKRLFDLKQIEANVKKGLKYKAIVLNAMLYEEMISRDNLNHWNNIAYYLQKNGQNREAILLLEEITALFPKRVVAYLNLGDAYWGEDRHEDAKKSYEKYIELMKAKSKEHKIPSVVKNRVMRKSNFEKNFIEVHKNVEDISPLVFHNKGVAKAISIVPWKQKVLLDVDNANDGKILKVIAYEKNSKMEFVYFFISTVKNEVGLLKLFGINQEDNSSYLIGAYPNNISYDDIENWHLWNREYFLVEDGYVYFNFKEEPLTIDKDRNVKEDKSYYTYRYKLGEKTEPEKYKYDVSDRVHYAVYNHKHTMYVDAENEDFTLGYDEKHKEEFIIKAFKGGFYIGSANWSFDDKFVYFDNHGDGLACIWRYNIENKELSKIVPEHEAEQPFSFEYKGKEYVVYIENKKIKVATP